MNYDHALKYLIARMDAINYYEEHPSRLYLKEVIDSDESAKEKVLWLVRDGILQRELYGNVLSSIDMHADPLEYFENNITILPQE